MSGPSIEEIFDACRTIFGSDVRISLDFLNYLQPSGVKAAYWKKAFETHPDMAKILGENEAILNERFKELTTAYETLNLVIKGNGKLNIGEKSFTSNCSTAARYKYKPTNTKNSTNYSNHFFKGSIPKRNLLIGQFLYYSGCISWQTLLDAVIWQRRQRPLIGQIAIEWGILSRDDIHKILKERKFKENFGECAIRKGLLTPFNLLALLGKQHNLQMPIGEYFIKNGIICRHELEKMLKRNYVHNKNALKKDD